MPCLPSLVHSPTLHFQSAGGQETPLLALRLDSVFYKGDAIEIEGPVHKPQLCIGRHVSWG